MNEEIKTIRDYEEDLTKIKNEKYDIQEHWLEDIAMKYLELDNINQTKVGLFGYINEIMATEARYAVQHRNFLLDEAFLNTASKTSSIYNKAKSYNYDIPLAFPSSFNMTFSIKDEHILKYGKDEIDEETGKKTGHKIFRIGRDSVFNLSYFPFMLENDVVIRANKIGHNEYAYSARYDFSSSHDHKSYFDPFLDPYIQTWVDTGDKEKVISIYIKAYQIEKKVRIFENYSSDLSDNLLFEIPYNEQLARFNVIYENVGERTYLNGYFNDTFTPLDDKYYFYSFSDNMLNITFSSLPNGFKPAINSKIIVETYTTHGSKGNFNYEGDILFTFEDKKHQGAVDYIIHKNTNPIGGHNMPTMKEIKQDLIYEFLTRDNLVTEFDLNSFFANIIRTEAVNDSEIKFLKKRDDVLRRLYGVYLLLRDKNGLVIPTNTINIDIEGDISKEFILNSGTDVVFNTQQYIPYNEETMKDLEVDIININQKDYVEYSEEAAELYDGKIFDNGNYTIYNEEEMDIDSYDISYKLPFTLLYKTYPYQRLLMIKDTVEDEIFFNFKDVNGMVKHQFIMSDVKTRRNSMNFEVIDDEDNNPNEFTLGFTVDTTMSKDEIFDPDTDEDIGNLKIRAVIRNAKNVESAYFDFSLHDTKRMIYTHSFITDNTFDEFNRICLKNSVRNIKTGEVIENYYIDGKIDMDIYFLIKEGGNNFSKYKVLRDMPDIKDYTMAVQMRNQKKIIIFDILNQVSVPILSYLEDVENSTEEKPVYKGFQLRNIPVVGRKYLQSYEIYKEFFEIFDIYYRLLVKNFEKLENNTGLDLKFYNTYGISKQFTIDNTHLNLELEIALIDKFSKDLDYRIKRFIIAFLEKVNKTTSRTFAISNLIKSLEDNFDDIDYIEFIKLNGKTKQKVLYDYPEMSELNQEQLINFIPEYINIDIKKDSYKGKMEDLDVGIKINYK